MHFEVQLARQKDGYGPVRSKALRPERVGRCDSGVEGVGQVEWSGGILAEVDMVLALLGGSITVAANKSK